MKKLLVSLIMGAILVPAAFAQQPQTPQMPENWMDMAINMAIQQMRANGETQKTADCLGITTEELEDGFRQSFKSCGPLIEQTIMGAQDPEVQQKVEACLEDNMIDNLGVSQATVEKCEAELQG